MIHRNLDEFMLKRGGSVCTGLIKTDTQIG